MTEKLANIKDMTPNERLVSRLRELLDVAEKGELRHLLYDDGGKAAVR